MKQSTYFVNIISGGLASTRALDGYMSHRSFVVFFSTKSGIIPYRIFLSCSAEKEVIIDYSYLLLLTFSFSFWLLLLRLHLTEAGDFILTQGLNGSTVGTVCGGMWV